MVAIEFYMNGDDKVEDLSMVEKDDVLYVEAHGRGFIPTESVRVCAACRRSRVVTAPAVRPLCLSVVAYVGPVRRPSEGVPQTPL